MEILIVDDEPGIRTGIAYPLSDAGHNVSEAADGAEALKLISERVFDVVFCDVRLPKIDGLTLFKRLQAESPRTAVVLMTAFARVADAKAAIQEGAYDYVTKPFDIEAVTLQLVKRVAGERALEADRRAARGELARDGSSSAIIGRSPAMVRLLDRLDTISQSEAPVLLIGESGTGKELIARELHDRGPRREGPFVAVNCAALPETLIEAELFGHERGAFTGAIRRRDGRFKLADGGTLLLDEIAEIPPQAQSKLLRALQEGEIEPVGSSTPTRVDVRIISATHQNLKERVADGRFREDLYYRLNVLDLKIPPLRERQGDLPLLLEHFLKRLCAPGQEPPRLTHRAWKALSNYPFPGNVREFGHAVERALVLSRGRDIDLEHLPTDIAGSVPHLTAEQVRLEPLATAFRAWERDYLRNALELAGGKKGHAAELLGISRKNLWEKLRAHGLAAEPDDTEE